jgi:hypothetical protein
MNIYLRAAAMAAALASSASAIPAFADTTSASQTGHFEWRTQPSYGPRAPTRAPVRVWVDGARPMAAGCDCPMMHGTKAQASSCMGMSANDRADPRG